MCVVCVRCMLGHECVRVYLWAESWWWGAGKARKRGHDADAEGFAVDVGGNAKGAKPESARWGALLTLCLCACGVAHMTPAHYEYSQENKESVINSVLLHMGGESNHQPRMLVWDESLAHSCTCTCVGQPLFVGRNCRFPETIVTCRPTCWYVCGLLIVCSGMLGRLVATVGFLQEFDW